MTSLNVSSTLTKTYNEQVVGNVSIATTIKTKAAVFNAVFNIEARFKEVVTPVKHTSIDDIVNEWSQDDDMREALENARLWYAEQYHAEDGVTIRTIRLKKKWSQAKLADEIGSSQSHIARIERGTENLSIETCRRLCVALDIDMNTLDCALKNQEKLHKKNLAKHES